MKIQHELVGLQELAQNKFHNKASMEAQVREKGPRTDVEYEDFSP